MDENDIVKHLKFTEETKKNFERRNLRSGRSYPVMPEKMRQNGVGTEINSITEDIADSPGDLYDLVW